MKTRKTKSKFTGRALAASLALSAVCGFAETPDYFVEWVKPTGNLYVDTGIRGKAGTKIYVRLYHADADNFANIIGASASGGSQRVGIGFWGESNRYNYGSEYKGAGCGYVPYTYDYIIEQEFSATGVITSKTTYPGGRKAQDVQIDTNTTDYSGTQGVVDSGVSLYLFARNNGGTAADFHRGRLYECKVWQLDANSAWQLVGNFMPCVKDGVAGVYDAASETILYPAGNTLTAGPAKYDSSWPSSAKVGSVDHPATLWGRIYYGAARSDMGNGEWKNIGLTDYTIQGAGDIANLNANSGTWVSSNLAWAQLRFDGWFYVSPDKAGSWTFQQGFDDYFSLTIDGVNIVCNPTYNLTANTAAHDIAEGWHRFTIIAGDTYGGYGAGRVTLDGVKVPFTVSINGGTAMAFNVTNFPQGSGSNTYTLTSNEDWSDRGAILLAGGAVLDLNGHQLTVKDIVCDDYLGAMVTNSASNKAVLIFTGEPSVSKAVTDGLVKEVGTKILLAKAGELSATWTGAADGVSANNAGNWVDTLTGEAVVPNANYAVKIAGSAVGLQIPAGSSFACKSFDIGACTLTANCDWTGLSVRPTISGTANLNGHTLTLNNLSALSGGTFTGTDGSAVAFPVSDTSYGTFSEAEYIDSIGDLTLSGSAKILLPKDGADMFSSTVDLNIGATANRSVEFRQTDGNVSLAIGRISQVAGAKATYTMTNGTLTASKEFEVGGRGVGEFVQTGGTATLNSWLNIGRYGGTGIVTVNGGSLVNTYNNDVYVGCEGGTGTINVGDDGYVEVYNLRVGAGWWSNNKGYINISGNGHLKTRNWAALCNYNGSSGMYGEVNQSGGTFEVGTDICVGERSSGVGVYNMAGGNLTANILRIGWNSGAKGTFAMDGGEVSLRGSILMGIVSGATGWFTMNGGTLTAPTITAQGGDATVVLNGGTLKASADGDIIKDVDNLVFGTGTTIDTDGHNTAITGCGYDTVPGSSFVKTGAGTLTAAMPPVDTLIVSNGVLALSAAADNGKPLAALSHRWSFTDGSLADSEGGAPDATTIPAENPALTFENGEVVMTGDGNSTGALNLGKGVVPAGNATIEIWATRTGVKYWSRVFDYGTGTADYFTMSWVSGNNGAGEAVELKVNNASNSKASTMQYEDNVKYHISVTATVNADGSTTFFWAKRDVTTGEVLKSGTLAQAGWTLAKLAAGNFYLGHSQWSSDFDANAKYDEVRIWRGALNAEALTLSAQKGPDATTEDIAAIVAKNAETPVGRTLDLAGGTLDLGGNTLIQPNLMGNGGTVRNGTLTITDTIRLNVGDSITASGTIDLSNAKVEIVDVENLSTPFWFIKPAENGTLTVVGTPEAVNLPSGWKISASSSGAKVHKVGFTIYVR